MQDLCGCCGKVGCVSECPGCARWRSVGATRKADPQDEGNLANLVHDALDKQSVNCRETFGENDPDCFAVARAVIAAGWLPPKGES